MLKSGFAYSLCFLTSLVVGHALIIVLSAYAPSVATVFVTSGRVIDDIFKTSYSQKDVAAFILATLAAFPLGILFHMFLKVERW